MSVSSWGRIFPSVCGGKRGITVDRGVGRSFGTVAFSSLTSGSGAFAGRGGSEGDAGAGGTSAIGAGGGGRIVDAREGRSLRGFSSSLTVTRLGLECRRYGSRDRASPGLPFLGPPYRANETRRTLA
jgi:hypothetical protein